MCHGGDRCTERSRSRTHGYDVGYQGEKERKNEKLTTKQLDHEGITLDEVRNKIILVIARTRFFPTNK